MANLSADEIITLLHKRNYVQWGGARPTNPVSFAGQDAQYISIDSVNIPEIGTIKPIWVPDPHYQKKYHLVGRSYSPPELPTITVKFHEKHGSLPRQLTYIGAPFNLYEATGMCNDLSDLAKGWTDYVMIYEGGIATKKSGGNRSTWETDEPIEDSLDVMLSAVYPMGALSFSEGAAMMVDREVVDICYQGHVNTGACGPLDDGTQRIYAVTKSSGAASPGLPSELIWTTDGGTTWNQTTYGAGASEDPNAIAVCGNYLVIVSSSSASPCYYYADLDQTTGTPGVGGVAGVFNKMTTGFVSAHQPNDIFVLSPREIYLVGEGGYIYRSTDITSGVIAVSTGDITVSSLKRVQGFVGCDVIIAVGASGAIVKSSNRGKSWSLLTTTPTVSTIQAVEVLDSYRYWIGHSAGRVFYTQDGGANWTELGFSDSGAGQVWDIVFPTQSCGYISYTNATPTAKIMTTFDGGRTWTQGASRILNLPTFTRANRLAYPAIDESLACNNMAIAGLSGGGVDGIMLIGYAAKV